MLPVRKPVRAICIFLGSGDCKQGQEVSPCYELVSKNGTDRILLVFQQPHSVFYHDFVLESCELDDFLCNPGPDDVHVDFSCIDLEMTMLYVASIV